MCFVTRRIFSFLSVGRKVRIQVMRIIWPRPSSSLSSAERGSCPSLCFPFGKAMEMAGCVLYLLLLPRASLDPAGQFQAWKRQVKIAGEQKFMQEAIGSCTSFRQIFPALQAPSSYPRWEYLVWGSEVGRKRAGDRTGIGWDIPEQIPVFLQKFKSRRRWALLQGKGNVWGNGRTFRQCALVASWFEFIQDVLLRSSMQVV